MSIFHPTRYFRDKLTLTNSIPNNMVNTWGEIDGFSFCSLKKSNGYLYLQKTYSTVLCIFQQHMDVWARGIVLFKSEKATAAGLKYLQYSIQYYGLATRI